MANEFPPAVMEAALRLASEMVRRQASESGHGSAEALPTPQAQPKAFAPPGATPHHHHRRPRTESGSPRSGSTFMMVDPIQMPVPDIDPFLSSQTPFEGMYYVPHAEAPDVSHQNPLPPGVPSLERWGQTIISWGKHKSATYGQLSDVTSDEYVSYRRWLLQRDQTSTDGRLRDLGAFLRQKGHGQHGSSSSSQLILIPGTSEARKFRDQ